MKLVYMGTGEPVQRGDRHRLSGKLYRVEAFTPPKNKITPERPGFVIMRECVQDALARDTDHYVTSIGAVWIK